MGDELIFPLDKVLEGLAYRWVELTPKNATYSFTGRLVEITPDYYVLERYQDGKFESRHWLLKTELAGIVHREVDDGYARPVDAR